jgi:hypothetical protein
MSKSPPGKSPRPAVNPEREARQAAALRANLLKRKDQARQREVAKPKTEPALPNGPGQAE